MEEKKSEKKETNTFKIMKNEIKETLKKLRLQRYGSQPINPIEKLKKILLKNINDNSLKEINEELDPHIEKFSILKNRNFLSHFEKYFYEKYDNNNQITSFKGLTDEDLEKRINKIIEYLSSSKINIEESEYLLCLLNYLNPFTETLKKIKGNSYKKILTKLIYSFKYEYYEKNNILFRFNDLSEKFYLIIKGEVEFLVPNEEYFELTLEEYIDYLLKLRVNNEDFLVEKTLEKNIDKYNLSEKNFDIWIKRAYSTICDRKLRMKELEKFKEEERERNNFLKKKKKKEEKKEEKEENYQRTFFKKKFVINISPFENDEEIEISMKLEKEIKEAFLHIQLSTGLFKLALLKEKNNLKNINSKKYIERLLPKKKNYGNRIIKKYNFLIYKYYISQNLSQGNFFGEIYTDSSYNNEGNKRIETVITKQNTDFAVLSHIQFNDLILDTFEKGRKNLLTYLFDLNVFQNLNLSLFMRNFTKIFEYLKIEYKEVLFNQNQKINENHFVYFIVEGHFDSFSKLSLFEMDNILLKTNLKNKIDNQEIDKIKNFKDYYNKKEIKFDSFGKGDIIGLNDCNLYGKYLYTVFCSSHQAFVYKVHISYIKLMITLDNVIKENFKKFQTVKTNFLFNMLLKQRKAKINSFMERNNNNILLNDKNNNNPSHNKYKLKISKRLNSSTKISFDNLSLTNINSNYNKRLNSTSRNFPKTKILKNDNNSNNLFLNNITNKSLRKILLDEKNSSISNPISLRKERNKNNTINVLLSYNSKSENKKDKYISNSLTFSSINSNINNLTNTLINNSYFNNLTSRNEISINENLRKMKKKRILFINKVKKKLVNDGKKLIKINEFSIEKKIKEKIQEKEFIDFLVYDNFNKNYNTFDYYQPNNYDKRNKNTKYYLLFSKEK